MRHITPEHLPCDQGQLLHAGGAAKTARSVRVLLIEDDEDDFLLTCELFEATGGPEHYQVEWAQTYDEGLAALQTRVFDICLLDYHLGARDGIDLLRDARECAVSVPIVVLTGESSRDIDQAAIDLGAADYLVKGEITTALLERSIRHTIERKRSQEATQLLAEAGVRLTSSLNRDDTLESVARLVAERIADYCIVDLIGDDGGLRRLRVAARDDTNQAVAEWVREAPLTDHPKCIVRRAITSQKSVLVSEVDQQKLLVDETLCAPHRQFVERIQPVSMMAVPLIARDRLVGAFLFVSAASGRRYDHDDLALAEQLAFRTALATDNARLYRDTQRAVERRDELHRVVAHDLRNPLSTVKMVADLLERISSKDVNFGELRKHLGVQKHAVSRMNRLIEDLLDVARIEAGQLSVEPHPCVPATLIRCVIDQHMAQAQARSISLHSHVEDGLPCIEADEDRLEQVFSNLLSNALKFTPEGGQIEVRASRRGDSVVFCVSDTGPGIAAEQLPHLFDRFWQADKATRHGAGLGLAITKGIIDAHGGRIWVDSEPGQGATFQVALSIGTPA